MLPVVEGVDLQRAAIARPDEADVARGDLDLRLDGVLSGISVINGSPCLSTEPTESFASVSTTDGSAAVSRTRS